VSVNDDEKFIRHTDKYRTQYTGRAIKK